MAKNWVKARKKKILRIFLVIKLDFDEFRHLSKTILFITTRPTKPATDATFYNNNNNFHILAHDDFSHGTLILYQIEPKNAHNSFSQETICARWLDRTLQLSLLLPLDPLLSLVTLLFASGSGQCQCLWRSMVAAELPWIRFRLSSGTLSITMLLPQFWVRVILQMTSISGGSCWPVYTKLSALG